MVLYLENGQQFAKGLGQQCDGDDDGRGGDEMMMTMTIVLLQCLFFL